MFLSEEMVEKFKVIYLARFGEEITKEEAYEQGMKLLKLMKVIYRPLPKEDNSKITYPLT